MNAAGPRSLYLLRVCLVAALGGLLFGYDTGVISGAIGPLVTHFGLSARLEGWATSCALAGCVLGALGAGPASDRWGRRAILFVAAALFLISALGTALPRALTPFIVFRIVGGVGVGAASILSPLYIAEITPADRRGRLVSINQLAIVGGFLVVYFANYFIALGRSDSWIAATGWRWMFGSEALPALALLILLVTVPESPRWLTQHGRLEEAEAILQRAAGPERAHAALAEIRASLATEPAALSDLLAPGLRAALLLGIALAVLQQVTGINVFLYYAPEIFKKLGSNTDAALLQTVVVGGVNLGFTVIAIRTVDRWGRRPLMRIGAAGMGGCLAALGLAAYLGQTAVWTLVFILGYIACFALSVGPVTWVLLSEIFPTRVRGRAMAVASFCLWIANFGVSQTFPMLDKNPTLVRLFGHALPFWIYAGFCVVLVVVVQRWVPETKRRSLEEIERFWAGSQPPPLGQGANSKT